MSTMHPERPAMQTYLRRGYFPDDAESAYQRWRVAATSVTVPSGMAAQSFDEFVRTIWLAGWYTRGEVAYGQPDTLVNPERGR
jgi:hypothetical protein